MGEKEEQCRGGRDKYEEGMRGKGVCRRIFESVILMRWRKGDIDGGYKAGVLHQMRPTQLFHYSLLLQLRR